MEQVKIEPMYSIDGQSLKRAFYAALVWLRNHQQVINSLNVFPVPDGDTGTNMFLTMQSAYGEISETEEDQRWQSRPHDLARRPDGCPR